MRISDWSSDVCSSDLRRLPRAAAMRQRQMGAIAEDIRHLGKRGFGDRVGFIRDEGRDQALAPGGDILPMEEALALLAFLAVDAALADGEETHEAGTAGAMLRPA